MTSTLRATTRLLLVVLTTALALTLPAVRASAQVEGSPVIAPQSTTQRDVKFGDQVTISGTITGATAVTGARMVMVEADGGRNLEPIARVQQGPFAEGDWVRLDGDQLTGRVRLGCFFAESGGSCGPHDPPQTAVLEVQLDGGSYLPSNSLRVDNIQPYILRFDLVGPNTIVAVFTEPVQLVGGGIFGNDDSAGDWRIETPSRTVTGVEPGVNDCAGRPNVSGCTRRLSFAQALGEDARPVVRYLPPAQTRPEYQDFAANIYDAGRSDDNPVAFDRIIPRVPSIQQIAGKTPTTDANRFAAAGGVGVIANVPSPTARVGTVTSGHTVEVFARLATSPNQGPGTLVGSAVASGTTVDVPLSGSLVTTDQNLVLTAVAVDPSDNRSTGEGSPIGTNGSPNPVGYLLDRVVPIIQSAQQTGEGLRQVLVTFSPDLSATPVAAGTWTLGGAQPTRVEAGSRSDQRLLTFAETPSPGSRLSWAGAEGSRYMDLAGNTLADRSGIDLLIVAPPVAPVFQQPVPQVTNAQQVTVAGTQQLPPADPPQTLVIQLYSDAEGTQTLGDPLPVRSNGTWGGPPATAPLPGGTPADQDVTLYARAVSTGFDLRSPVAQSAVVTVDRVAPGNVAITQPSSGSILGGPADPVGPGVLPVAWTAEDPNPGTFALAMTDVNGGMIPCSAGEWREGSSFQGSCEVPSDVPQGNGRITLVATDAATNTTSVQSVVIPLDPGILGATASLTSNGGTLNSSQITLRYTQALTGSTSFEDWRADDGRRGPVDRRPISAQLSDGGLTVTLTFAQPFPPTGAHRNATPRYTYNPPAIGQPLRGQDGEAIPTSGPVLDVEPARLDVVAPPGRVAGTADRPSVCTGQNACPPSGPVLLLSGSTDSAFDRDRSGAFEAGEYNSVIVYRGDRTTPQGANGARLATATVTDNGGFTAVVPLSVNQPLTFSVVAEDINPLPTKPPTIRVFTVIDDSIGPVISRMLATVRTQGPSRPPQQPGGQPPLDIDIDLGFDEVVNDVVLEYRTTGDWLPIQQVFVNADSTFYRWSSDLTTADLAGGLQIRATATDIIGNVGTARIVGISNLPTIIGAAVLDEDTVTVTTSEAVTTGQLDAAGFSIGSGPGVRSTSVSGTTITLDLADPLENGTYTVRYNGQGGWVAADAVRPLAAGSAPISISDDVLFPVTALAAGPTMTGAVVSFVDERNEVALVTGYEVGRNGTIVDTLDADDRILQDGDLDAGTYTYTVTVLGLNGLRSDPRSVTIELGPSPVDEESKEESLGGGTGAPTGSEILEDCPFPPTPNIDADGGIVLSCDGRVAALVPAGAASGPMYGALIRRSTVPTTGFDDVTDLYQLIGVHDDDGYPVVDAFDGYVELSYRALGDTLEDQVTERVTVLRPFDGAPFDEKAARVGTESVATQLITVGTFGVVEADGASVRVFGPDPAIPSDRFATAVSLSQTQYRTASFAVLARADDYPDALAAAPLAAQLGAPVLLSRTADVPFTTLAELARLQTEVVFLVGGEAALSADVVTQLEATGRTVRRLAGPSRFDTAAVVARVVGSVDGSAFIATGSTFADALAASAPAAAIGRPILLSQGDALPAPTRQALDDIRAVSVHLVGGEQAIGAGVADGLAADGFSVRRSAGATRYATAVALAASLVEDGDLGLRQILMASGDGDGITSPDALAAGPISGRLRGVLLLTPKSVLAEEVRAFLADADALRGLFLAGGNAAVTDETRASIDAAAGGAGPE